MIKIMWLSRYKRLVSDLEFELQANVEAKKENDSLRKSNVSLSKYSNKLKSELSDKTDLVNGFIKESNELTETIKDIIREKETAEIQLKDSIDCRAELDEWRKRALWEEDENARLNVVLNGYKVLIEQNKEQQKLKK